MSKPRYIVLLFPILMSLYMVTAMSFVLTWANTGLGEGFLSRWWRAFYISWPVAIILITFGASRISSLVRRLSRA